MTLLEDIQNAAVDSKSDLAALLRKCKLLAARHRRAGQFSKSDEPPCLSAHGHHRPETSGTTSPRTPGSAGLGAAPSAHAGRAGPAA
jgi:AbiTii